MPTAPDQHLSYLAKFNSYFGRVRARTDGGRVSGENISSYELLNRSLASRLGAHKSTLSRRLNFSTQVGPFVSNAGERVGIVFLDVRNHLFPHIATQIESVARICRAHQHAYLHGALLKVCDLQRHDIAGGNLFDFAPLVFNKQRIVDDLRKKSDCPLVALFIRGKMISLEIEISGRALWKRAQD